MAPATATAAATATATAGAPAAPPAAPTAPLSPQATANLVYALALLVYDTKVRVLPGRAVSCDIQAPQPTVYDTAQVRVRLPGRTT